MTTPLPTLDVLDQSPQPHDRPSPDAAAPASARLNAVRLPPELESDDLPGALFGYDRSTIVKLLDSLRERFQVLAQERAKRDVRIRELELELLRSREGQRLIGETLVAAREEAQAIRENARRDAQELLRTVRKRAERILAAAEGEAAAKARELVATAERERRTLLEEAGRAKAFVEDTHEQLSDFLMAAVKWYEQAKLSHRGEQDSPEDAQPAAPPSGREAEAAAPPADQVARPANETSSIPSV